MRLDRVVALQRLADERVAVLGTVDEGGAPHLVPVTFAVLDGLIVFAIDHKSKSTLQLRRLDNVNRNPLVSFLVDGYDDAWERLWWVRADGTAEIVTSGEERVAALDALAAKYQQYQETRPTGAVVISRIRNIVGWAI